MDFIFNPKTQRYHYKQGAGRGQFVPTTAVKFMMERNIEATQGDIKTIGELLANGRISLSTWEQQTAIALKHLHTQSYLLGRGGKGSMSQRDYGLIGFRLKKEYKYLREFAQEIQTTGVSKADFFRRLEMYSSAGSGLYQKARTEGHSNNGFAWERRVRTKTESCQPCIMYEGMGWQPIGTLPNPTEQCSCHSNCGCFKEFRKEKPTDFVRRLNGLEFWNAKNFAGVKNFKRRSK